MHTPVRSLPYRNVAESPARPDVASFEALGDMLAMAGASISSLLGHSHLQVRKHLNRFLHAFFAKKRS